MPKPRTPLAVRFWRFVEKTDACWLWTGPLTKGYGSIGAGGREGANLYAHRVAWELAFGPIAAGLFVCHSCDTPRCVNPAHLFLGSNRDNILDAKAKGRLDPRKASQPGQRNARAKLTDEDIRIIRATYKCNAGRAYVKRGTGAALAEHFGVNVEQIRRIAKGVAWRNVADL